ncbi:hypothetical protein V6N11_049271 [Hibiscus sabdariffa]|uniref:Uncharacterized protein n=2 Tax=Hibiscus sabdariffa TaxID=183260 RepID=A0ABR2BN14_9ROSI
MLQNGSKSGTRNNTRRQQQWRRSCTIKEGTKLHIRQESELKRNTPKMVTKQKSRNYCCKEFRDPTRSNDDNKLVIQRSNHKKQQRSCELTKHPCEAAAIPRSKEATTQSNNNNTSDPTNQQDPTTTRLCNSNVQSKQSSTSSINRGTSTPRTLKAPRRVTNNPTMEVGSEEKEGEGNGGGRESLEKKKEN